MLRQIIGLCAVLILGSSAAEASTTGFIISGHDADNPATTIVGGESGGTSHVTAEGGADYTVSFSPQPSPKIVLSAAAGSSYTSFRADYLYTIDVSFLPPLPYMSCCLGEPCTAPVLPIGFATGRLTIDGAGGVAYAIAYAGAERFDGGGTGDGCYDGNVCKLNENYRADLFLDRTTTGGATGGDGTSIDYTFYMPLDLNLQGNLPGDHASRYTLSIDPVITLNPAFFAANGIDPSTARLTFEPGIGNATSNTPEPATWAFLLVGFGGIGVALRHTRRAIVPSLAPVTIV